MKKAVIFLNGDSADCSRIRSHIDQKTLLIGCDGGVRHMLALGLVPHVVVGDLDSISPRTLASLERKRTEIIRHPEDKSHTDSELCVMLAKERGFRNIILTGVRGTHTDHMLGNLFLLAKEEFASLTMKIVEGKEEVCVARKRARIDGKKGDLISLLPIGRDVLGVSTKGLVYALHDETLFSGSTRSLRNRMTGQRAEVVVRRGALLVVHRFA